MKSVDQELKPGSYYHIFNRGINGESIFLDENDYSHFLKLYSKYIHSISETFSWTLLPNHFHLLIRLKENLIYKTKLPELEKQNKLYHKHKWDCMQDYKALKNSKPVKPHLHFSHLFNSYVKYFNKKYERHGGLFERPFKRIEVENENYLKNLVIYIHNNPLYHGVTKEIRDYKWSSYSSFLSKKQSNIKREEVINYFNDLENFVYVHKEQYDIKMIEDYLIE